MRELKVGDNVCLRDDLEDWEFYGVTIWAEGMKKGVLAKVSRVYKKDKTFYISDGGSRVYTYGMVDWDKTEKMWEGQQVKNDEKIVMPKFFDDWYQEYRGVSKSGKVLWLSKNYLDEDLSEDLTFYYNRNQEKCYRAILDGYEVEKEKLYTVYCGGNKGVVITDKGSVRLTHDYSVWEKEEKQLTQSEIENSKYSILMAIAKEVSDEQR